MTCLLDGCVLALYSEILTNFPASSGWKNQWIPGKLLSIVFCATESYPSWGYIMEESQLWKEYSEVPTNTWHCSNTWHNYEEQGFYAKIEACRLSNSIQLWSWPPWETGFPLKNKRKRSLYLHWIRSLPTRSLCLLAGISGSYPIIGRGGCLGLG